MQGFLEVLVFLSDDDDRDRAAEVRHIARLRIDLLDSHHQELGLIIR